MENPIQKYRSYSGGGYGGPGARPAAGGARGADARKPAAAAALSDGGGGARPGRPSSGQQSGSPSLGGAGW